MKTLSETSVQPQNPLCDKCQDTGRIYSKQVATEGKFIGRIYTVMRDCLCKLERLRQKRLSVIPRFFQNVNLADLQPHPQIHALQKTIIPVMKANPFESYFIAGKTGKGKTLMMWSLYREAVMNDKKVIACTLTELLNEYKAFIQASINNQELIYPRISAGDLRQNHTRFSIFLDDIDKAKPTEYAMEQLFELANAIYEFGHQVVVTTNLRLEDLQKHFERADERFGGAIVRRLTSNAHICEMF